MNVLNYDAPVPVAVIIDEPGMDVAMEWLATPNGAVCELPWKAVLGQPPI